MFRDLPAFAPTTIQPAIEHIVADPSPPQPAPPPPTRFGATRIVIVPDPNQSMITIIETPNDTSYSDYTIFINREISGNGNYYGEVLTLLNSLTIQTHVVVYIGSPGGSLHGGAMIANALRNCKAHVTTIATGIVASAAALIWSYGHSRKVVDGAAVMIHMSSHCDWGNSALVRTQAENTVRYVKEVVIDPLVEQGILTSEEAESIIDKRRDLWLDSTTLNERLEKSNGQVAS
jgi:ATP-dependent protease ClpP protease subunit